MAEANSLILHDGDLIGYVYMNPYQVGCIPSTETRFKRILAKTADAVPAHEPVETPVDMPVPPRINPTSVERRAMDVILELDRTTDLTFEDTTTPVETLHEETDLIVLETEEDIWDANELYEELADAVSRFAPSLPDMPAKGLQREFEDSVKAQTLEAAIQSKEDKYLSD